MSAYPGIARACLLIALDNGGINRHRSVEQQALDLGKFLATRPDDLLAPIDAWLAGLSDTDLNTFCCGGAGEPETDALLALAPAFADALLNDYFDEVC